MSGKTEMDLQEEAAMRRYEERFGDGFPRCMCGITGGPEFVALLDECVRTGKEFDPYQGGKVPADAVF